MTLTPYPEYKDSGVPWLGKIPTDWEAQPNRSIFAEIKKQGHISEPLLSVTIKRGIILQSELLSHTSKKDTSNLDKSKYKLVCPNDIAYNKMRGWQGAFGLSKYRGIVSPAYVVLRVKYNHCPNFFHYLLRTSLFAKEAERHSYGITPDMWSLRPEHFRLIYIPIPAIHEQIQIARFLDWKISRINKFIRNKKRLIELLKEQKQVIINRAVTRGLNPGVKLKPSGTDWLGDIPEHWESVRLKTISKLRYGLGQPPREDPDGITMIRATNVSQGTITKKDMLFVDKNDIPSGRGAFLSENEIIVVRSGAYTGDSAIIPKEYSGAVAGYDMVLTVKRALPAFVAILLLSTYVLKDQFYQLRTRAAQPHLNTEEVGSVVILLPPPQEQAEITDYVKNKVDEIHQTIAQAEREISLITEYKERLISDVVTGKVDVRGVKVPKISDDDLLPPNDEEPENEYLANCDEDEEQEF